ncbi:hypothetical protein AJ85_01100 [Alkalihalobacillus alcalophilus ATCC 27647 = CGMCC 1.3604]|uniref:ABC3 transporter permease C-terminal domain-containing protein n=1 Tax=Alkalihalobacillus alcalophilus ATCC 27647 = CGMCC 1.3604 TaxID=1218173 RepID=A0A094YQD9_ALKAL|nr:ABC transporter permease [Alkalihalobacillus alcalophilus]KGA95682.1 hypothetical protein BALCAV_0220885 [Alkalihalobacillus alcalophilus ATCC 27647 = CGMCC 1.3604]THG88681.1 hypothetical protein AJ85_01100 [Alkalihalobacillus alcalophilus ATCC 27647 = CGMCC 1.3604]
MIVSPVVFEEIIAGKEEGEPGYGLFLQTDDPVATQDQLDSMDDTASMSIHNSFLSRQADENMMKILSIFVYGFITLITLISIANIFNTISTSIALRKREFAMLKSVGMTPKSFNKMIYFESIFYGLKSTLYGLPISIAIMYYIYYTNQNTFSYAFELPWVNIVIVVFAVFMIVGAAMLYSMSKVKKENIIDALKQENI